MIRVSLLAVTFLIFNGAVAQITFTEDIAPIIYNHCSKCHRDGEIGGFALTNYDEISEVGETIVEVTSIGYMPPWRPDPDYRHFLNENVLTDEQRNDIATWVADGMPFGNPDLEPELPTFPTGSQVGVPDMVLTMAQAYEHQGTNSDQYQIFVLPTGLTEDVDIEAVEVRADNNEICHHAILGIDTTGTAAQLDAADPEYGYTQFGGFGFDPVDQFLSAWVPGAAPVVYPPTIGKKLFAGSDILLQMHYGPTPVNELDQTEVNIFFADDPVQRYIVTYPISPLDLDESFIIPPNEITTFHGTVDVPIGVSLLTIAPHAHLLGSSWEVYAVSDDNTDTIPLIRIPEYNFNWQGAYSFPNLLHIPAGYTIHCFATYDNTVDNPLNPNDPPAWSWWGEGTEDEMYLCYLQFVWYQNGDENISQATLNEDDRMVYPVNQIFPGYPNPAKQSYTIGYSMSAPGPVSLSVFDSQGKKLEDVISQANRAPGKHREVIDTSKLPSGIYLYQLNLNGEVFSAQFAVSK